MTMSQTLSTNCQVIFKLLSLDSLWPCAVALCLSSHFFCFRLIPKGAFSPTEETLARDATCVQQQKYKQEEMNTK